MNVKSAQVAMDLSADHTGAINGTIAGVIPTSDLVAEFKKKGLQVIEPNKKSFQDAIQKAITLESMGYTKADWDKIQAIK